MTEKRFQWVYIKDNTLELYDNGIVKVFNNERLEELLNDLSEENEQLKQELIEFKKWGKYVGDVKREDLDKVFKMSIYEIAEAFTYYEKRIKELEE